MRPNNHSVGGFDLTPAEEKGLPTTPYSVKGHRGSISARKFVGVILIVIILLFVNLIGIIIYLDPFSQEKADEGPQIEGHPWLTKVSAQVIRGDSEWIERTGKLGRPVRIVEGGTLRLIDCHLELHHDDAPWFKFPFFFVEEGGTLELINTTIEAVPSTIPDDALVGPFPDEDIPHISRVVNLEGAERPILTFDLRWRFWGTPLSVAVQRDHYSDVEVVETIDPQGPSEGWEHVEVSLAEYVNELPRVIIYFSKLPMDVYFIKDLNISDDGAELPFDLPTPENDPFGLWQSEAFYDYKTTLSRNSDNRRTIQCNGSLIIRDSTIQVPTEIHRFGSPWFDRENIQEMFLYPNTWISLGGMHIQVDGGSIDAKDSMFMNAALRATASEVLVSECIFESPYDMITVNHCTGTLSKNTFTMKGEADGLVNFATMDRSFWAISVYNNTEDGPVSIVDCDFHGVEQAIDLGYAIYSIDNCLFENVIHFCIWEHACVEATPWEVLKLENTFQHCPGQLYIKTVRTDLFFNSNKIHYDDETFVDTDGQPLRNITTYSYFRWMYFYRNRTRLIRLDMLVESLDSVRIVNHTEVRVYTNTPPYRIFNTLITVVVPTGVRTLYVDEQALFNETVVEPWNDVTTDVNLVKVWSSGEAIVGTYNLTFVIETEDLLVDNVTVNISMDDEVFYHVDDEEFWLELDENDKVRLDTSQYLPPGIHDLRVVISGYRYLNETLVNDTSEVIFNKTFQIMRASKTNTSTEIERYVRENGTILAIDANTTFELRAFEPMNGSWYGAPNFFVTGGRGSGLIFRNLTSDTDLMVLMGLYSHVNLHFIDTKIPRLNIVLMDEYLTFDELMENDRQAILGEIRIDNCTRQWMELDIGQYSLSITNSNGTSAVLFFSRGNSTIYMENLSEDNWRGYASGPIWSYTIKDCYFRGDSASGLEINVDDIRTITITNTTFDGASLGFEADSPNIGIWELDVSGCQFIGDYALLFILWNTYGRNEWGDHPSQFPIPLGSVSGNTFSGNGTTIVLHPSLYERTFIENTIDDSVRMWAWYWTNIYLEPETDVRNVYELVVLENDDIITNFPEPYNIYLRYDNYFNEVTEQVGGPIEHPSLKVAIQWENSWDYGLLLATVVDVDLSKDRNDLIYPVWPNIQMLLPFVIDDWPWKSLEK